MTVSQNSRFLVFSRVPGSFPFSAYGQKKEPRYILAAGWDSALSNRHRRLRIDVVHSQIAKTPPTAGLAPHGPPVPTGWIGGAPPPSRVRPPSRSAVWPNRQVRARRSRWLEPPSYADLAGFPPATQSQGHRPTSEYPCATLSRWFNSSSPFAADFADSISLAAPRFAAIFDHFLRLLLRKVGEKRPFPADFRQSFRKIYLKIPSIRCPVRLQAFRDAMASILAIFI